MNAYRWMLTILSLLVIMLIPGCRPAETKSETAAAPVETNQAVPDFTTAPLKTPTERPTAAPIEHSSTPDAPPAGTESVEQGLPGATFRREVVETNLGLAPDPGSELTRRTLAVSQNGKRLAFLLDIPGQDQPLDAMFGLLDGELLGPYDNVSVQKSDQLFIFSPDSQRVAYGIIRDGQHYMVIDGRREGPYEGTGLAVFSPDSLQVGYKALLAGRQRMVLNGEIGEPHDHVDNPHFSPDSQHVAYALQDGDLWYAVLDGVKSAGYDDLFVTDFSFSTDSRRFGHLARRGNSHYIVIDGEEYGPYDEMLAVGPIFSPGSQRAIYGARERGQYYIFEEGVRIGPFSATLGPRVFSPQGDRYACLSASDEAAWMIVDGEAFGPYDGAADEITFSPDGSRVAFAAREGEEWITFLDGQEIGRYHNLGQGSFTFTSDSQRFAYGALEDDGWYVFIGQDKWGPHQDASVPIIGPKDKHVAYLILEDDQYFAVTDGEVTGPYDAAGRPAFSPGGQYLAYAAKIGEDRIIMLNGNRGESYDFILGFNNEDPQGIFFESETEFYYLAIRAGELYLVEETILPE